MGYAMEYSDKRLHTHPVSRSQMGLRAQMDVGQSLHLSTLPQRANNAPRAQMDSTLVPVPSIGIYVIAVFRGSRLDTAWSVRVGVYVIAVFRGSGLGTAWPVGVGVYVFAVFRWSGLGIRRGPRWQCVHQIHAHKESWKHHGAV